MKISVSTLFIYTALLLYAQEVFAFDTALSLDNYDKTVTVKIGDDVTKTLDSDALKKSARLQTTVDRSIKHADTNSAANMSLCLFPYSGCDAFASISAPTEYRVEHTFFVSQDTVEQLVNQFSQEFNIDPEPMIFEKDGAKVSRFSPGRDGRKISASAATQVLSGKIRDSLTRHEDTQAIIPYESLFRNIPKEAKNLGIVDLVGSGSSDFAGSPTNRIFNIKRALQNFEGQLIAPDEEFSFTKILGPVEEETGYRPELVIRNNKTEPEYGGGICQVSTTLFRAAIYSGLKITERHNHSYPVTYYKPIGFDATVYVPRPDLKFKNNTHKSLLIHAAIEGTVLTFELYGTPDGRTVTLDGPAVIKREDDGSMTTSMTQTVLDSSGDMLFTDTFKSWYDNPKNYLHPEDVLYTEKPKDWSKRQWNEYKKTHAT